MVKRFPGLELIIEQTFSFDRSVTHPSPRSEKGPSGPGHSAQPVQMRPCRRRTVHGRRLREHRQARLRSPACPKPGNWCLIGSRPDPAACSSSLRTLAAAVSPPWWRLCGWGGGLCLGEAFDRVQPPVPLRPGGCHGLGGCVETVRADGVANFAASRCPSTSPARARTAKCLVTAWRAKGRLAASMVGWPGRGMEVGDRRGSMTGLGHYGDLGYYGDPAGLRSTAFGDVIAHDGPKDHQCGEQESHDRDQPACPSAPVMNR